MIDCRKKESPNSNSTNGFTYQDDLIHSSSKEIMLNSDIVLESFEESIYMNADNPNI